MSSLPTAAYLTRIGPIDRRGGDPSAIYLALTADGERLAGHVESPPSDAAAIRALAAALTTHAPSCAIDLAAVGASLGFDVGELPPRAAEARAIEAYRASSADYAELSPSSVRELCMAAAEYEREAPWTKLAILRRFPAKEILRVVSTGNVLARGELLVQVHAQSPDGPRLHVECEGSSRVPFRAQVTLAKDPGWVADAVAEAFGERVSPLLAHVREERLVAPKDEHALLLAAAMRAAVDRMRGGAGRGRAGSGLVAYELEVDFEASIPLAPRPIGETPSELRAIGRLMAETLATNVPLPYYDDYVCVVLDRDDPQTEPTMELLDQTVSILGAPREHGFADVYKTAVAVEHFIARWMRPEHMAKMIAHNGVPEEWVAALGVTLPPFALRVMLFGSRSCEAFFVYFAPLTVAIHREELRARRRLEETGEAEEDDAAEGGSSGSPPTGAGTWRDGRGYLPRPLPADWSVGAGGASGALTIAAGPVSAVLVVVRAEGRRWVRVYFREHPEGRPVTREEARAVYERLVGCGRFGEMTLVASDAERVPLAGARLFAAPLAAARPRSAVPARTERETAALIERAKPRLAEVMARVRDEKRLVREYCVLLDAKGPLGASDGVIMTRELVEEIFATPESDPFQIRARFEEPRPGEECVVFVKHEDGIEEIHVSLESVNVRAEREA